MYIYLLSSMLKFINYCISHENRLNLLLFMTNYFVIVVVTSVLASLFAITALSHFLIPLWLSQSSFLKIKCITLRHRLQCVGTHWKIIFSIGSTSQLWQNDITISTSQTLKNIFANVYINSKIYSTKEMCDWNLL